MRTLLIYKILIAFFLYKAIDPQKINIEKFCLPLKEIKINETFGHKRNNGIRHHGVDLEAKKGTNVYAIHSGKIEVHRNERLGNYIIISNPPYKTTYAHLSKVEKEKVNVECGEKIGESGSTGFSFGPHLHIETQANEVFVNPLLLNF